ncbi:helix-turn-helix domain-containing protein [Effusibacillus pohliae]|uniref:helix-turn-helix domain-containing protein n=1 Tax=Effusibacillus pohliae TaxID=232270 RepID=UPI0003793311|nr:helix-turn-helix transcriptional regulator [Effusibacillus pohliae]
MKLHVRLTELRKRYEYTQQQVADFLGISRGAYANYEIGKREPDADTLAKLAELYDTTVDYLLTGRMDTAEWGPLGDLSPEDLEILEKIKNDPDLDLFFKDFASAPEEHQRDLIKIWKALHGDKEEGKK